LEIVNNWLSVFSLPPKGKEDFGWMGKCRGMRRWKKVPSHGKCSSLLPFSLQAVRGDRARLLWTGRDRAMLWHPGHAFTVTKFLPDTGIWALPQGTIHIFAIIFPLAFLLSKNKRAHTTEILLGLTLLCRSGY